ncbi:MAG: hypothetical protein Q9163_002667, partial [Psora crenata]
MPLDTTPPDPSDTFTNPSTPDPYESFPSTSSDPSRGAHELPSHIDDSSLPHGLPILGPLTGYTAAYRASTIAHRYKYLGQTIKRPLTREEQSAVAYHSAKGLAISSWGPTLGLAAGVYRTWTTRDGYRWPLAGRMKTSSSNGSNGSSTSTTTTEKTPNRRGGGGGFWDGKKMRVGGKEVLKDVSVPAKRAALHFARGSAYVLLS